MITTRQGTKLHPHPSPNKTPTPTNATFPSPSGSRKSHGMSRRSCPSSGGGGGGGGGSTGERDYFFLNTKGICLFCYEECDPVTNEEKKKGHTQTSINFSRLISRYLGFSMEDVIASPLKTVGRKSSSLEEGEVDKRYKKVAFDLCERCVGLAEAFNQVYFQVQFHQMILDRCVRSVSDIIRKASKKSINELFVLSEDDQAMQMQQKSFTRLTLGGIRSAHRLRTKLFKRSLAKLSNSFPMIKLKRINKSGDWNLLFKKPENNSLSKNGMVAALAAPTAPLLLPKNPKQVLLASFLGCIVSFWIVISLSFINLDQLVIKIKKEKLIELKLERDIGVDVVDAYMNGAKTPKKSPSKAGKPLPTPSASTSITTGIADDIDGVTIPKKRRPYTKKNDNKRKMMDGDDAPSPKEPVQKRKYVRKPKQKVAVIVTNEEEKLLTPTTIPTTSTPLSVVQPTPKNKPVVIAPPQPKPSSVQNQKGQDKQPLLGSKEQVNKSPMMSSSNTSQYPNPHGVNHQQQYVKTAKVPPTTTVTGYSSWQPPTKPTPLPTNHPASTVLPSPQYQPQSQYAASPSSAYLPAPSQPQTVNVAPSTVSSTQQYAYIPNSSQAQYLAPPSQQPQANSYYADPSTVPSPSTPSYQANNPYYTPPPSVPPSNTTTDLVNSSQQQQQPRRPSYNGITGYNIDPINDPSVASHPNPVNNNYNYSYNSTTYNYSNNASSSWPSSQLSLGETTHPTPASSLPPLQTPGYSYSSLPGEGTTQSLSGYVDYNTYGDSQLTPLGTNISSTPVTGTPSSTNTGSDSSTTNIGIYAYDGYGNYVLQQSYPTYTEASTSSSLSSATTSTSSYYGSMLPPMPPSTSTSALSYLSSMEPKVESTYPSSQLAEEPPPSLTYEEPPVQLHDMEVEEQQSELEDPANNSEGDPESKSKSLSVFPEAHWRQQSTDKRICCSHSSICTEQFITNAQLQLHLRTHGTFTCSFCQLSFGKAHNLALHEKIKHPRTGTGNKGKCPRCEFHMTPSTYKYLLHFLNNHLNISVHDDPCDICNKPFVFGTKSINRRNHFKKYHDTLGKDPETIKKCTGCNAPFLKETQLKDHQDKMHCSASTDYTARASSVASSISVTTAEEITYTTAVATADQIIS